MIWILGVQFWLRFAFWISILTDVEGVTRSDNNKLNDKLYNIQVITNRENLSKDKKRGTSKYIGVCWSKREQKWTSQIRINGKKKGLGYYKTEQEASQAYQNELKKLLWNKQNK